jgi:flavin-dependent dehydrogenase
MVGEITPSEQVDVVVVGARVAGSTVAALLGDSGARVLLVDRASFPSPTLSTHFFRGGQAVSVFDRLGVLDRLLGLGAPPLRCEYTYVGDPAGVVGPPQDPGEIGFSLSVRREALDEVLVRRAAASPGVELAERTRLDDLLWRDGRVVGVVLDGPNGRRAVSARLVIGADGRRSRVAKLVGAEDQERRAGARTLYYRYVRGFTSPGVEIGVEFSVGDNELVYVFPSDDGFACVAVSSPKSLFSEFRANPSAMLDARIARHPAIAARYESAQRDSTVLGTAPEDNYVRIPCGEGWALVGDAGMHQDPWSGRGIDMAAVHAATLADELTPALHGGGDLVDALARYHARRNEHGLDSWRSTVTLADDLTQLAAREPPSEPGPTAAQDG